MLLSINPYRQLILPLIYCNIKQIQRHVSQVQNWYKRKITKQNVKQVLSLHLWSRTCYWQWLPST